MSDSGNIKIHQKFDSNDDAGPVYLYTHSLGSKIYGIVKRALSRNQRWNDPSYLARIVFCELVKGHEDKETGFGISTKPFHCDHHIIGLNCLTQMVTFEDISGDVSGYMSFEDFVNRKDKYSNHGEQ